MTLSKVYYRGLFDFHQNCSLIHHILMGEMLDGHPIIAFPKDPAKVVRGKTYEFMAKPTLEATYTIEDKGTKTVYRVVHALDMKPTDNSEGDFVDSILYHSVGDGTNTLADALNPDLCQRLKSLGDKPKQRKFQETAAPQPKQTDFEYKRLDENEGAVLQTVWREGRLVCYHIVVGAKITARHSIEEAYAVLGKAVPDNNKIRKLREKSTRIQQGAA